MEPGKSVYAQAQVQLDTLCALAAKELGVEGQIGWAAHTAKVKGVLTHALIQKDLQIRNLKAEVKRLKTQKSQGPVAPMPPRPILPVVPIFTKEDYVAAEDRCDDERLEAEAAKEKAWQKQLEEWAEEAKQAYEANQMDSVTEYWEEFYAEYLAGKGSTPNM